MHILQLVFGLHMLVENQVTENDSSSRESVKRGIVALALVCLGVYSIINSSIDFIRVGRLTQVRSDCAKIGVNRKLAGSKIKGPIVGLLYRIRKWYL
jgi:hypothetical protein